MKFTPSKIFQTVKDEFYQHRARQRRREHDVASAHAETEALRRNISSLAMAQQNDRAMALARSNTLAHEVSSIKAIVTGQSVRATAIGWAVQSGARNKEIIPLARTLVDYIQHDGQAAAPAATNRVDIRGRR